jgi:hypothetical protein
MNGPNGVGLKRVHLQLANFDAWVLRVSRPTKANFATIPRLTESQVFFGGQYLEFHTYNSHGNCFYMYLMSISTLFNVKNSCSDYLDLHQKGQKHDFCSFDFFGLVEEIENWNDEGR